MWSVEQNTVLVVKQTEKISDTELNENAGTQWKLVGILEKAKDGD